MKTLIKTCSCFCQTLLSVVEITGVHTDEQGTRVDINQGNEPPRFCGMCGAPYLEKEVEQNSERN